MHGSFSSWSTHISVDSEMFIHFKDVRLNEDAWSSNWLNQFYPRNLLLSLRVAWPSASQLVDVQHLCSCKLPSHAKVIWDRFHEKGPSAYDKICYKNALRSNRYNFRTVNAIDFLYSTFITISVCRSIFSCLTQAPCRRYETWLPMGFETATSSGRSVQFVSNSVCM